MQQSGGLTYYLDASYEGALSCLIFQELLTRQAFYLNRQIVGLVDNMMQIVKQIL